MFPTPGAFFTVRMPFDTTQWAGVWSWADTHSSSFLPSNNTIASEGGAASVGPGVTILGTGCHTSVSSGLALAGCCAERAATMETRVANARNCESRTLIDGLEDTPPEVRPPSRSDASKAPDCPRRAFACQGSLDGHRNSAGTGLGLQPFSLVR